MSPLALRVALGFEDERLLEHIANLEGFAVITAGERLTLKVCWRRLKWLTR